jgi:hypothetical protein
LHMCMLMAASAAAAASCPMLGVSLSSNCCSWHGSRRLRGSHALGMNTPLGQLVHGLAGMTLRHAVKGATLCTCRHGIIEPLLVVSAPSTIEHSDADCTWLTGVLELVDML